MHNAAVQRILARVAPGAFWDRDVLDDLLQQRPTPEQLAGLLADDHPARVQAALLYLGVFGSQREVPVLALCLHHQDSTVAQLAENCLWAIWMQAGDAAGTRALSEGLAHSQDGNHWAALCIFNRLVEDQPDFAEAHFQRGLVLAALDRTAEALVAFREALRLNPYHFAALAAIGHALVEQGDYVQALEYYRRALRIYPRLADVPEAVEAINTLLARRTA
jgi:tetratricopeptide (TPR) repeat protein